MLLSDTWHHLSSLSLASKEIRLCNRAKCAHLRISKKYIGNRQPTHQSGVFFASTAVIWNLVMSGLKFPLVMPFPLTYKGSNHPWIFSSSVAMIICTQLMPVHILDMISYKGKDHWTYLKQKLFPTLISKLLWLSTYFLVSAAYSVELFPLGRWRRFKCKYTIRKVSSWKSTWPKNRIAFVVSSFSFVYLVNFWTIFFLFVFSQKKPNWIFHWNIFWWLQETLLLLTGCQF